METRSGVAAAHGGLKPAEQTPVTRWNRKADTGAGSGRVVNIVPGYGETAGAARAANPGIDKVRSRFDQVGKMLRRRG